MIASNLLYRKGVIGPDRLDSLSNFYVSEKAISHLASADHLKNIKSFIWKYGGGMDRVDHFCVSEVDLAKYKKKCMSMKSEGGGEQSCGPLIGPSNDIHNELKYDYVDNCDKSHISSYNLTFPNHVLPLQNPTNENYQVSHSDHYGGAATSTSSSHDNKSLLLAANTKHFNNLKGNAGRNCLNGGYLDNGLGKTCQVYAEKREANGEGSSAGLLKLTQISSTVHEVNAGNVHSGAPPPWFNTTNGVHHDPGLKPVTKTVKSKLNPKRVGAAWAEKRKLEIDMERRGELPTNKFDANWLPNFGRVWQSGSRKDSLKEFETEAKKPLKEETQSGSSLQLQPYVSKRMVSLS
ncbi:TITAN-like protein isoform X1 [Tanacetum coccineum]